MANDVFTKNEILQNLASKGYFIDSYTLDTFLNKWKVEAIFEDEQGSEFYDKNTLDLVLENLFHQEVEKEKEASKDILEPTFEKKEEAIPVEIETPREAQTLNTIQQQAQIQQPSANLSNTMDEADKEVLSNISLSDGTPLIDKINDIPLELENITIPPIADLQLEPVVQPKKEKKMGILEGALASSNQEAEVNKLQEAKAEQEAPDADFDDISLLSESLEAQEKFKEYVISEMQKKNADFQVPTNNEFKIDISEKTINMVARTLAKKIAKHVTNLCTQDSKSLARLEQVEEQNKKLEKRAKELEDQNRKLRLLLTESNKNLNSYKPSFFGLYKKVPPTK